MILFFIESHSRYGFLIYGMFFVLFFGLDSDVHVKMYSSHLDNFIGKFHQLLHLALVRPRAFVISGERLLR